MKSIPVQKILNIVNPTEFKLHTARYNGVKNPLDVYAHDKDKWRGWNTWGGKKNIYNRKYIFSLIDFYKETDMWLFGGAFAVTSKRRQKNGVFRYGIKDLKEYTDYVGRLKIKMQKPRRGRSFVLENHLDEMTVSEILKEPYSGEAFLGYDRINHSFSMLEPIFHNENADWKIRLEHLQGVYVITDTKNGKKYVGSAYGSDGIWARWRSYIKTGHGGNKSLVQLIKKEGVAYARSNFQFSLLECWATPVGKEVIDSRETHWKKVFLSRGKFGYNEN
ncbi:MAG: GIY-YIG nuclease family protein [Gammaproteobacteria bacterium]|nr:GIY-YIG nuclease family protein [Gammaproteobacteria bacterium]CAJ2376701.1 MAG: GIY-YIG domain-containing protein [Arenicellales bacterium IbO2]MDA7961560.1 GIY-YIG nuclease family protein [Gammaproteobacteria bacterium]MDA7970449.1 GIY-YIG nuclease family protein [Gammaproteobacteria bacterium]MDA7995292.1 GIY-YIG nuclease family protein [Gammaproteobacteria bacterium]